MLQYFTLNNNWITKWKSKGLSNGSLEVVSTSDNTLTPSANRYRDKVRLRLTGSVLQQKAVKYSHKSCKSKFGLQNNQLSRLRQLSYTDKCTIWSCYIN